MPVLNFRVSDEKKALIEAEAEKRSETVSELVRRAVDAVLRRGTRKAKGDFMMAGWARVGVWCECH